MSSHVPADQQVSLHKIHPNHVTPLFKLVTMETPRELQATPMPPDMIDWNCYAPIPDFPAEMFNSAKVASTEKCTAFYDSSFKSLFGKLFDSLLKDERMI